MPMLTLIQNGCRREIPFFGSQSLKNVLFSAGVMTEHPCGGIGTCGKCAVHLAGAVSEPNAVEQAAGTRLSCQAVLLGDTTVWLAGESDLTQIGISGSTHAARSPMPGRFGAAVDIGTTTIALTLCRLSDGASLASTACGNPQRTVSADVIGRIEAALSGALDTLQDMVLDAVQTLLLKACRDAHIPEDQLDALVITGNTTMLYLLTGKNPDSLARAPFHAECLFGCETKVLGRIAYLPSCMDAFVGADITCAVLASQMTEQPGPALLCDIGTNGEIALWKDGTLYVTSTAAGPAFEGAGISCGCGSVMGAIDRVWLEDGSLCCHTIGEAPAVGLCGSGLIDAVAVLLARENVDETGAMDEDAVCLSGKVHLLQRDIRAVQLAKAAIAAGIQTILETTKTEESAIKDFYICGGFGTHLNLSSAAAIGLIPKTLAEKAKVIGNGALAGAIWLLLDQDSCAQAEQLSAASRHVNLGGNHQFNANYIENMLFPEI